jgi:hypothetical protein
LPAAPAIFGWAPVTPPPETPLWSYSPLEPGIARSSRATSGSDSLAAALDYIYASPLPTPSVTGVVNLQGVVNSQIPINFTFYPVGGGQPFYRTVTPNDDGSYALGILPGNYNVAIVGPRYLQSRRRGNIWRPVPFLRREVTQPRDEVG